MRIFLLFFLVSTSLIAARVPTTQAQSGIGISGPEWVKTTQCTGPYFPTDPSEYVESGTDIFNLSQNGTFIGNGQGLSCGPVGTGSQSTTNGTYHLSNSSSSSTDLHWNESYSITPKGVPNVTLDSLLNNLTEHMYVNGYDFADLDLKYNRTSLVMHLIISCDLSAYHWSYRLSTYVVFTNQSKPVAGVVVICGTALGSGGGGMGGTGHFDGLNVYKSLNATYTSAIQPSSLRKVTDLNYQPLERTYINYENPIPPPISCYTAGSSPTYPPSKGGDLGIGISQDPVWVRQGTSQFYAAYMQLYPNIPADLTGDTLEIGAFANVSSTPSAVPVGLSLAFGSQPAVAGPNLGRSTITGLFYPFIPLTVFATAKVPSGLYKYFLNVTDLNSNATNIWGVASILVCPGSGTSPVTPIQILLSGSIVGIAIELRRRTRAAQNLGRIRRSP